MARLPAAALVALALLAGCASPQPASDDGGDGKDGAGLDPSWTASQDAAREVFLLPGEVVSWEIGVPGGQQLDLHFRVYQGLVDFTVEGPGKCDGFEVQAAMVSGPAGADVANKDCGTLEAGTYRLGLHAGKAAFRGAVELRGGWFGPTPGAEGGPSPTDEQAILVTPGEPQDFTVRGQGKPMRLVIGMDTGLSVGGDLTGPRGCEGDDLSFNVLAVSTSGQALAVAKCEVLSEGLHTFHLDAGDSAFYGYARLYDATFA